MKQIPLREFQLNASDYLGELPVTLTRYGHPVAFVCSPEGVIPVENPKTYSPAGPPKVVHGVVKFPPIQKSIQEKNIGICKHGAAYGNCKYGCVKSSDKK